jgi:hypothetical protein
MENGKEPITHGANIGSFNLIHTLQFAEWIAERYNYIGGESCCWCAKQYDIKDTERYKDTGELFAYWFENCTTNGQQKPICLKKEVKQNCDNCKYEELEIREPICWNCSQLAFNKNIAGFKNNWRANNE